MHCNLEIINSLCADLWVILLEESHSPYISCRGRFSDWSIQRLIIFFRNFKKILDNFYVFMLKAFLTILVLIFILKVKHR